MRIAFYSPRASHLRQHMSQGGDPVFLYALFDALAERGHELKVVSHFNPRDLARGKVPVRRLFTEARALRREVARFQPDAWLVYRPSRTYPDLFGWWLRPRRYVLLAAQMWQASSLRGPWRSLFALAHRRSLARADALTSFRPSSADHLRDHGVAPERLLLQPPGVNVPAGLPSRDEARARLGLPLDAPIIMSASRFTGPESEAAERKTEMVLNLLADFARLPRDVILFVVGDGPGRPLAEEQVARLGLQDRARIMGRVDDINLHYAACDVFAYPVDLDRAWMAVLEAQAAGRPVVTMRTRTNAITLDDGRTGLLAKDRNEFRAHLAALASDRARCDAMGRAARDYIQQHHSIQARARQIEDLLTATPSPAGARFIAPEVPSPSGRGEVPSPWQGES